jgi:hypothetical protein
MEEEKHRLDGGNEEIIGWRESIDWMEEERNEWMEEEKH